MATIEKRGPYQFRAKVRVTGTPTLTETFTTRAEAERWAEKTEEQIRAKTFVDVSAMKGKTLFDILTLSETDFCPTKKGEKQELNFIGRLKGHPLSRRLLLDITPSDIRKYRDERLKTVGPGTVIRELGMISSFFNYAISECDTYKHLKNPVSGVRRPRAPKHRTRRFLCDLKEADYEYIKILEVTQSETFRRFLKVAVNSAMRRGELVGLQIENVLLDRQKVILPDTKNGTARIVALSEAVTDVLREQIGDRKSGSVFGVKADSMTQAFGRARERAREAYRQECLRDGVQPEHGMFDDLRLHDARHEGTSRLFEVHKLSIAEAASITGHTDPRQLMGYTNLADDYLVKKLG
ncbi:site-specific integrase [Castellaniella sp.]|uniref:tyrosine-type recombinase/integrase n=1 Tax=Castellaniella sp. TaxID=1955812 RepID=UPI002B001C4C|nr:site-specific integrase [Castellaniella sp.]